VIDTFSATRMADRYEDLYARALQPSGGRREPLDDLPDEAPRTPEADSVDAGAVGARA
jgi:hypothetical protein